MSYKTNSSSFNNKSRKPWRFYKWQNLENHSNKSFGWNLQAKSSSKTIVNKHKDAEDKDGGVIDLKKLRGKEHKKNWS